MYVNVMVEKMGKECKVPRQQDGVQVQARVRGARCGARVRAMLQTMVRGYGAGWGAHTHTHSHAQKFVRCKCGPISKVAN